MVGTICMVTVPSWLVHWRDNGVLTVHVRVVCGKSIQATLSNLNGELCVRDHSKPLLGHSIMSFRIA